MNNNRLFFLLIALSASILTRTRIVFCIDYSTKMARAEKMIARAAAFFKKTTRNKACRDFTYSDHWQDGSLTVFVDDIAGTRLVSRNYPATIPETDLNLKNLFDEPAFPLMLEAARKEHGGWVPLFFLNSLVYTYVKAVKKEKRTYILGTCIFCDYEPELICRLLLKAVDRYVQRKKSISDAFDIINNAYGPCIYGSIYAMIIDMNGKCRANGGNTLLINQNLLAAKSHDAPVIRKIIDFVKKNNGGTGFIEVRIGTYVKKIYFKKIINPRTQEVLIALAGYSPTVDKNTVYERIEKIKKLFADYDREDALAVINNIKRSVSMPSKSSNTLIGDDLNCMILDRDYIVRAYDKKQDYALVGRNYLTYVDQKGMPFTQSLKSVIDAKGAGWVTRYAHNTLERLYTEKIETESGPVIAVIFGYYPYDRREIGEILTDDAYHYLKTHASPATFGIFVQTDSPFIKGDMHIHTYDSKGFCWTAGLTKTKIWSQDTTWPKAAEGWVDDRRTKNVLKRFKKNIGRIIPGIGEEFMIGTTYFDDRSFDRQTN